MHLRLFLASILFVSPAIADTVTPATPVEAAIPAASGQDAVSERRKALEQRVAAKWDAQIRHDFDAVYSFTSPAYRQQFARDVFKRQFAIGKIVWQRIEVMDVEFKGDDAAKVGINIYFVYYLPQAEKTIDMSNYVQESWVRSDGQWWYLAKE
jgi:uncharacterized protein YchJ